MTQREIDRFLMTDSFRQRVVEADHYAEKKNLDRWATRVLWVSLTCNVQVAHRYAQRRANFRASKAWDRLTRFLDRNWGSLNPEGIYETWKGNYAWEEFPLKWFDLVVEDITSDHL